MNNFTDRPTDRPTESDPLRLVKLRNGSEDRLAAINATMFVLEGLMETDPIVGIELVMKCRDPKHQFFENTGDVLKKLRLVGSDEHIHESVRNIVLSSASGEGLEISFHSPVAPAPREGIGDPRPERESKAPDEGKKSGIDR